MVALLVAEFDDAAREVLVDEEGLAAGLRVHPDHRVDRHLLRLAVRRRVVERRETLAEFLQRRRQLLVGLVHVGPHRVAADRGAFDHVEDRHHRGALLEADVAVPLVGDAAARGHQLEDLGVVRERVVEVRVPLELAEVAAEADVLLHREVLVGKEEDLVLEQQ